jgi:hypothetical protein
MVNIWRTYIIFKHMLDIPMVNICLLFNTWLKCMFNIGYHYLQTCDWLGQGLNAWWLKLTSYSTYSIIKSMFLKTHAFFQIKGKRDYFFHACNAPPLPRWKNNTFLLFALSYISKKKRKKKHLLQVRIFYMCTASLFINSWICHCPGWLQRILVYMYN